MRPRRLLALVTLFISAAESRDDRPAAACGIRCAGDGGVPVCGSDGQTYRNGCLLQAAQCHSPSLTMAYPGACVQLPFPLRPAPIAHSLCGHMQCTKIYAPLCGSDGRTYGNACEFAKALCDDPTLRVIRNDACPTPTPEPSSQCLPRPCAAIYMPVCGSDGQTYGNACVFSFANCLQPSLSIVHDGECGQQECLMVYQPVCGSDGQTYSNRCMFDQALAVDASLRVVHNGECDPDCAHLDNCLDVYDPVCGSDGNTYPSTCVLQRVSCVKQDATLVVAATGECARPVDECLPLPCAPIDAPVCASNGQTYGNACVFSYAKCLDPALEIVHDGACNTDPGDEPCPFIYEPVCGSDGDTYPNECVLRKAQPLNADLTVVHAGECGSAPAPLGDSACPPPSCPRMYAPICGSDGETYANDCFFQHARCLNETLAAVADGACDEQPGPHGGAGGAAGGALSTRPPVVAGGCAALTCQAPSTCVENESGEAVCLAKEERCGDVVCGPDAHCEQVAVRCVRAPCPAVPMCVPGPSE